MYYADIACMNLKIIMIKMINMIKMFLIITFGLKQFSICLQFLNTLSLATPCKYNQTKMIFSNIALAVGSYVMKKKSYVTC